MEGGQIDCLKLKKLTLLQQYFPAWPHLSATEQQEMLKKLHANELSKRCLLYIVLRIIVFGVLLIIKGRLANLHAFRRGQGDHPLSPAAREYLYSVRLLCTFQPSLLMCRSRRKKTAMSLLIGAPFFAQLAEHNIYVECFSYKVATERFF